MPSWNIHTAHVERLAREEDLASLGVRDVNAFLLGNLVPDIYVGYMVPDASWRIDYKLTHLAQREHIPLPRDDVFWDFYVARCGEVSDVVLGAWAHLACDRVYNTHTRRHLEEIGVSAGERARIGKQSDFALFGRTLPISMAPEATDELVSMCASFPQYEIAERDVRASAAVAAGIVEQNRRDFVSGTPTYSLLTAGFFEAAREEAHAAVVRGLRRYVSGL